MDLLLIGGLVCSWQLFIEPELRTNRPKKRLLHPAPPDERVYEPEGVGVMIKKGEEVGVLLTGVFQNLSCFQSVALFSSGLVLAYCCYHYSLPLAGCSFQYGFHCSPCFSSTRVKIAWER